MKLLVKDRVHPVGDIIFRCFALAFNCKYISFVRDGLNLGKNGYTVNVRAIISAVDPNKCDAPLLDWCLRKALVAKGSQHVCPGTRSPEELGRGVPLTHPQAVHWGQVCVVKMMIAVRCGSVPICYLRLIDIMIYIHVSKMTGCVHGYIFR